MKKIISSNFFAIWILVSFNISAFAIGSGELVNPQDFEAKSTVLVFEKSGGLCSGTLIAPDIVLTAAHCVTNLESFEIKAASEFFVYFGNWPLVNNAWAPRDPLKTYELKNLRVHPNGFIKDKDFKNPDWTKNWTDLALLQLAANAPKEYVPVKLLRTPLAPGSDIVIAGFGSANLSSEPLRAGVLYRFRTKVAATFEAIGQFALFEPKNLPWMKDKYSSGDAIEKKRIEEAGVHGGDSGGPAYLLQDVPYIAGVNSWNNPGDSIPMFQDISSHAEWIDQTIQEWETAVQH